MPRTPLVLRVPRGTPVVPFRDRSAPSSRIWDSVRERERLAEPVELPVVLVVVYPVVEVQLAHLEERGRGEKRVRAGLVRWAYPHDLRVRDFLRSVI